MPQRKYIRVANRGAYAFTFGKREAVPPSRQNARISSSDASASMNSMSAPASAKAAARQSASCAPAQT